MADREVVYAIHVEGAQDAITQFERVGNSAAGANSAALGGGRGGLGGGLDRLASQFQSLSRDIDTVAGRSAQGFAQMANDVLGVGSALLGGPISAGLVAVTAGVGALTAAWKYVRGEVEENAATVSRYHDTLTTSANNWRKSIDEVTAAYIKAGHTPGIQEVNARIAALNMALREQTEIIAANEYATDQESKTRRQAANLAIGVLKDELESLKEKRSILNDELQQQLEVAAAESQFAEQKAATTKAEQDNNDQRAREHAAALTRAAEEKRIADEDLKAGEEMMRQLNARNTARIKAFRDEDEAQKKLIENERKANEEREKAVRLEEQKREELIKSSAASVYASSVAGAYSVAMFGVGQSLGFATSQLQQFQNINRDNWRDMLMITEDTKAAFAAQAQAFMFNLGLRAGQQSIFENAEGIKEAALAAGSFAFGDIRGGVLHAASSAIHYASSAAYGTIAVGAVGGSFAVGAMRGEGGLVKSSASTPSSTGAGGGQGPSSGRAGRGGSGTGQQPVVVNITYEPGAYGSDDARAARSTARAVRNANRDWFARRDMRG